MALGGLKIRVHGAEVTALIKQGDSELALQDLPWEAAQKIGLAFLEAAKQAEEYAKANAIIQDQAILFRSGAPMALSQNPKILDAAANEAFWNDELRRSNLKMAPGGIPSLEQVGVPSVTLAEPNRAPAPLIIPGK